MKEFSKSIQDYENVLQLEPENKRAQVLLNFTSNSLCSLQICRIITTLCFKSELCLSTPKSRTKYHDLHLFPQNVRL